ncbi:hypothetical protein FIBSPDRAFT_1050070 [Athelia psychrophila]|uniref:Uncharacterized protein n=1 Tax=Athelia psychrophila TaxID=1759441 RepID=A0A166B7G0_9AGAM|nr:hypothetical protein FIBSPDRAFT_1050070 [Fibularhizoctonia sp. CBS 109695]
MTTEEVLSHFGALDELIQIIYEGIERFVLLSSIDDIGQEWIVHLGLQGPEGRWWRGSWSDKDILRLTGANASETLLEGFADKIADAIVKGNAGVGDWVADKGAKIHLTLGDSASNASNDKPPMRVPLVELSTEQAASHATRVFWNLATEAQSRKCRINGGASYSAPATTAAYSYTPAPAVVSKNVTSAAPSLPKSSKDTSTLTGDKKIQMKRASPGTGTLDSSSTGATTRGVSEGWGV